MNATIANHERGNGTQAICARTETRSEACACGACARGSSPDAKHRANKRDVRALLDLIAGCVEYHPSQQIEHVKWAHVGDAAHLRERLMDIAVGFALGPDGDERDARHRLEEALSVETSTLAKRSSTRCNMGDQRRQPLEKIIEGIAREKLGVSTLETRRSDALDFHDVAVWQLRAALEAAYQAGLAVAKDKIAPHQGGLRRRRRG